MFDNKYLNMTYPTPSPSTFWLLSFSSYSVCSPQLPQACSISQGPTPPLPNMAGRSPGLSTFFTKPNTFFSQSLFEFLNCKAPVCWPSDAWLTDIFCLFNNLVTYHSWTITREFSFQTFWGERFSCAINCHHLFNFLLLYGFLAAQIWRREH